MTLKEMLYSRTEHEGAVTTRVGSTRLGIVGLKVDMPGISSLSVRRPFYLLEVGPFSFAAGVAGGVDAGMCEVSDDWKVWERLFVADSGLALGVIVLNEKGCLRA